MSEITFLDEPAVDRDAQSPHGIPCEACGTPVEKLDKFCPACGTPNPRYEAQPQVARAELIEEEKHKYFRCQQCGAEVATDPNQLSYTCPFCDSNYVAEYSPDMTGRQLPEFVIGFAVTPEQAHEKFKQWLRDNRWYRPGDLVMSAVADKMKGVYLPFWSFSMLAESSWRAQIGEYWYRTETYTTMQNGKLVTKTRQVRETEWWPLAGNHHRYYSGYLVSGSKGLPQAYAERIMPFNLPALKRYEPYFLAGWLSEQYSVARDEALVRCQHEFYRREQGNVASHLPGDTHSGLTVHTNFSNVNSDLCVLPVYVLSYKYRDKLYRFLVNGQTGKVAGDKPISWQRIWIVVGIGLGVLAFLILVFVIVANLR